MVQPASQQAEDPYLEHQRSELVMIVDEQNEFVRYAPRKEMRDNGLWHRVSFVYIVCTDGTLLVQKRSQKKDYCPGFFDLSTGGVVGKDETDLQNAVREVEEEIGIKNAQLESIKSFKFDGQLSKVHANVYVLRGFDPETTPLTLQTDEVDEVVYWTKEQIIEKHDSSEV